MRRPLNAWIGRRVTLAFPGHPDHGKTGIVFAVRRQTSVYVQRAVVRWDDGDVSYVPVSVLKDLAPV